MKPMFLYCNLENVCKIKYDMFFGCGSFWYVRLHIWLGARTRVLICSLGKNTMIT